MPLSESLTTEKDIYLIGKDNASSEDLVRHVYSVISTYKNTIKKNNQTLSTATDANELEFRDQGFTRPIALVLAPLRNSAFEFINSLISVASLSVIQSRKRFVAEFGSEESQFRESDKHANSKPDESENVSSIETNDDETKEASEIEDEESEEEEPKIKEPEAVFKGNIDDCFRLGVRIGTRSIALYEKFYGSDLIIASPLSLRMLIGSKGDTSKKHDHQFLSSIRLLIVLQADIIQMQNLDHLTHVLEHINLIPKKTLSCDFSRIQQSLLDGKGREIRQSILATQYPTPELTSIWRSFSNISGSMIITLTKNPTTTTLNSTTRKLLISKLENTAACSNRLSLFNREVLNGISRLGNSSSDNRRRICLYVPSYLDFVQIRALLVERGDISFKAISEYSSDSEIVGARSSFFNRHVTLLLVSERLLYFKRLLLRGIETLIFYAPPTDPSLYDHLVEHCIPIDSYSSTTENNLFLYVSIPQDLLALERLVGPEPIAALLQPSAPSHILAQR